jgi:hypothetical protein
MMLPFKKDHSHVNNLSKTPFPLWPLGAYTSFILLGISTCLHANILLENITPSFIRHPLDSAYLVCAAIKNNDEKASLMSQTAIQYALSGDYQIAVQIGFDLQKTFPDSPFSTLIFPEIGAAMAQKGQRNNIIAFMSKLKDTANKQLTAEYIALTYIQQRQLDIAQSFIREISNTTKRTRLLLQLSEAYANDSFFQKADLLLKEIPASQSKNQSLMTIAVLAAKGHQATLAQLLLMQVTDPEIQGQGLAEIVNIASSNQQFPESLRIANSIVPAKHRAKALAYLAGNYAKYRQFTDAWNLADGLNGEAKDIANSRIAKELGELGEFQNAENTLIQIKSQEYRLDAIIGIAKGYVQEGNYDKAVQIVQDIGNETLRNKGLITLGKIMGTAQQYHYVQLLIRQFRPNDIKNQAFSRYVGNFMKHAAPSRVLRIVDEINDAQIRNDTLNTVTDYYLNSSQFNHAQQSISAISSAQKRHEAYLKASQMALKTQNTLLAQNFLNTDLDTTIPNMGDKPTRAMAMAEVAIQFVDLQQLSKAETVLDKAYDLIKGTPNWQQNKALMTTITNAFILTDDSVTAYQLIMNLPRLEDQTAVLLQAPNGAQTASSEKKRRAILRELARSAQLRPK